MGFSVVKQLSVYAVHIWVVLAIVARTNADICSSLQCPETQTEDASGSAAELQDYEIVVSKKEFTPGGGIKVDLRMRNCLHHDTKGPDWYVIEAVTESRGSPAGSMQTVVQDTHQCNSKAGFVFKSCEPTVLDFPASYIWYATNVEQENVCFKARILNGSSCQLVSSCVSPKKGPWKVFRPTPLYMSEDEQRCTRNWHCNTTKFKLFCVNNEKIYPSLCHIRRQKCTTGQELRKTKNLSACALGICIQYRRGFRLDQNSQCTCTGKYKRRQCGIENNQLYCWCLSPDGYLRGNKVPFDCANGSTYNDLDC